MNILILEDSTPIRTLTRLSLKNTGHTILEAASAEEAFRRFDETDGQIDLLIADVTLPDRSGIDVAAELQSLLPNLRVVVTSGYPMGCWASEDAERFAELPSGSVITLQKPYPPSTLLNTVLRLLGMLPAARPQTAAAC